MNGALSACSQELEIFIFIFFLERRELEIDNPKGGFTDYLIYFTIMIRKMLMNVLKTSVYKYFMRK